MIAITSGGGRREVKPDKDAVLNLRVFLASRSETIVMLEVSADEKVELLNNLRGDAFWRDLLNAPEKFLGYPLVTI